MTEQLPEKEPLIEVRSLLPGLERLDWSKGLTREQVRAQDADLPAAVYMLLPSERRFASPEELIRFYVHAWQRRRQPGIPATGAAEDGGPDAWGPSPPSTGARRVGGRFGVGSGHDTGFTGSDEVGSDRSGATYGPHSEEPEIESDSE